MHHFTKRGAIGTCGRRMECSRRTNDVHSCLLPDDLLFVAVHFPDPLVKEEEELMTGDGVKSLFDCIVYDAGKKVVGKLFVEILDQLSVDDELIPENGRR